MQEISPVDVLQQPDPITAGLPPDVTPIDELYVIEKVWPDTKPLATAVSPEADGATYPLVWTHEYQPIALPQPEPQRGRGRGLELSFLSLLPSPFSLLPSPLRGVSRR